MPQIPGNVLYNACSRSVTETVWTNACSHVQPYEGFLIAAQQVSEFHCMNILRSEQSGVIIVTGTCCYSVPTSCLVTRDSTSAAQAEAVEGC